MATAGDSNEYVVFSEEDCKILVKGLAPNTDEELLNLYFDHHKSGGGGVKHIELDTENASAVVTFEDAQVVQNVLEKTHTLSSCIIHVEKYIEEKLPPERSSVVLVVGVADINEEMLDLYFSNVKKSGGGDINKIQTDGTDKNRCYISFDECDAAATVVERGHVLAGKRLDVSLVESGRMPADDDEEDESIKRSEKIEDTLSGREKEGNEKHSDDDGDDNEGESNHGDHLSDRNRATVAGVEKHRVSNEDNDDGNDDDDDDDDACSNHEDKFDVKLTKEARVKESGVGNGNNDNDDGNDDDYGYHDDGNDDDDDDHDDGNDDDYDDHDDDDDDEEEEVEEEEVHVATAVKKSSSSEDDIRSTDSESDNYHPEHYHDDKQDLEHSDGRHEPGYHGNDDGGEAKKLQTVEISGIPRRTTLVQINNFLGSFISSGTEGIGRCQLDYDSGIVIVTFKHSKDARKLLEQQVLQFGDGNALVVRPYETRDVSTESADAASDDVSMGTTVEVHGIPQEAEVDHIEVFFENKKRSGGGDIKNVEMYPELSMAFVTFVSPQDALEVVLRKTLRFDSKTELTVDWPTAGDASSTESESDLGDFSPPPQPRQIKVTGLPSDAQLDTIQFFFENKRRTGGGPTADIQFDSDKGTAIITYHEHEDAANVVERRNFNFSKQEVEVEWYEEVEDEAHCSVRVSGIPSDSDIDDLQMLFENKKRTGGGPIKSFSFNPKTGQAVIEFENQADAKNVVNSTREILLGKSLLTVEACSPESIDNAEEDTATEAEVVMDTIKVTGFKEDDQQDVIFLFFENKRRSGGGDIKHLKFEKSVADITYKNSKDAASVVEKYKSSGLMFNGNELTVYELEPTLSHSEDGSPSQAVIVSNIAEETSNDILLLFFENTNRSGGGHILEIERISGTQAVLTFGSAEIARNVASRKPLKLEGSVLEAQHLCHQSPPVAPTRGTVDPLCMFLSDMPSCVDADDIKTYLGYASKSAPVAEVVFGPNPGTALVKFESAPDYTGLRELSERRPLRGFMISIGRVPKTNFVQVFGLQPGMSDFLKLHLENTRRSGGGPILEYNEDHFDMGYVIVKFQDSEVVKRIIEKKHVLSEAELDIKPYHKCLGVLPPEHDVTVPVSSKIPEPLSVDWENKAALNFLLQSPAWKQRIEDALSQKCCSIQWPSDQDNHIVLKCKLDPKMWGFAKLCSEWEDGAFDVLQEHLALLSSQDVWTVKEVFDQLHQDVKASLDQKRLDPKTVQVEIFEEESLIQIAGEKELVDRLGREFSDLNVQIQSQHQLDNKTVTDSIRNIKPWDFALLKAVGYMKDINKSFPGLEIIMRGLAFEFRGKNSEVTAAKMKLLEIVNGKLNETLRFGQLARDLLREKATRNYLYSKMPNAARVVWNSSKQSDEVTIYAMTRDHVQKGKDAIQSHFKEASFDMEPDSEFVFATEEWSEIIQETKEESVSGRARIEVNQTKSVVSMAATSDLFDSIHGKIQKVVKKSLALEKLLKTSLGVAKLLDTALKPSIQKICEDYARHGIKITAVLNPKKPGALVKGSSEGLGAAIKTIQKVIESVRSHTYTVSKPGMAKYFYSRLGTVFLDTLEKQHGVGIEILDDSLGLSADVGVRFVVELSKGRKIIAMQGDMTKFTGGAIVNAANESLNHGGGVAGAIVKAGGKEIQKESSEYVKKHGKVLPGRVCVTGAGKLPCSYIVHAVGPTWRGGHSKEEQVLFNSVYKALEAGDEKGVLKIALPAISTGVYRFPLDTATKTIVQTVESYFIKNSRSGLREVVFMDVLAPTVKSFYEAMCKVYGQDAVKQIGDISTNEPEKTRGPTTRSMANLDIESSCFTTEHGVTMKIVTGTLATEKVDAMVNSTNTKLDLAKGFVSKSLLEAAGQKLQDECRKKKPEGIKEGEVFVTRGYSLPCRLVLHAACKKWEERNSEKVLETVIKSCLKEADEAKAESIAFPALGTGGLKIPAEKVAEMMVKLVKEHSSSVRHSMVRDVRVILTPNDAELQEAFQKEIRKGNKSRSRQGEHKRARSRSKSRSSGDASEDLQNGACCMIDSLKLEIVQGDITKEKTDAIVNSSDKDLGFHGGVSKALLKAGGDSISAECKKIRKPVNLMAVTSAGKLDVSHIIHVVAASGKSDWTTVVQACLKQAEATRITSISLPALGTGMLKCSTKEMATILMEAIHAFVQDEKPTTLKHVRIVIFQKEMVEDFVKALQSLVDSENGLWRSVTRLVSRSSYPAVHSFKYDTSSRTPPRDTVAENGTVRKGPVRSSSKLVLQIFGATKENVGSAVKDIDSECRAKCVEHVLSSRKDQDAIARLTEFQIKKIKSFEETKDVKVTFERYTDKKIMVIEGQASDAAYVLKEVMNVLRDVEESVRQRSEGKALSAYVMWEYEVKAGSDTYTAYPYEINSKLEQSFKAHSKSVKWMDGSVEYKVDFTTNTENITGRPGHDVKVRRTEKGEHHLPKIWKPMKSDMRVELVSLDPKKWEYQQVEKQLKATSGLINIVKIARIQNPNLFQRYAIHRESMEKVNPKTTKNEQILWHGTSAPTVPQINAQGFNRSYCGQHGTSIGKGVYFATNASYSIQGYSTPDSSGNKHIYMCRVLTGRHTPGNSSLIDAPAINSSDPSIKYDSVSGPGMFVIFSDTQAYPEYLITFH